MLSVRWEPHCTRISLHRMFLRAPSNVMDELTCYLRREVKSIAPAINRFIETNLQRLDYSDHVNPTKLYSRGEYYDLEKIYHTINKEYFNNSLELKITWFGKPKYRRRSRMTLGLYHDHLRLVKIHRFLDSPVVPTYVISYVVYHEMLHHVCRAYYDNQGRHKIHTKEFKKREEEYKHFTLAKEWILKNQNTIFY
mgnify:CR=1 FL=1